MLLTISAMMKTTMLDVIGMVEHAVTTKMMDGIHIVQNANVLVSSKFLGCSAILVSTQAIKKIINIYFSIVANIIFSNFRAMWICC